jgi:hypothetical protein
MKPVAPGFIRKTCCRCAHDPTQPARLWIVIRWLVELWLPRMSVAVTTRS